MAETRQRLETAERVSGGNRTACRSSWKVPSLTNSWANRAGCEAAGYALDNDGTVHLKGVVTTGASGTSIFTLPVTVRPAVPRVLPVAASGGLAKLTVGTDGTVVATSLSGSAVGTWVSLSGALFSVDQYPAGSSPMGTSALAGDGAAADAITTTRRHLGGMIMASGRAKAFTTPVAQDELFTVGHIHASPWRYPITAVGNDALVRLDLEKTTMDWIAGADPSTYLTLEGIQWPSLELWSSIVSATLASGVTQYPTTTESWCPQVSAWKDSMGMCWVGGIFNITNAGAGDDVFTLPVGYRPVSDAIVPCLNNNVSRALRIKTDGVVELEAAGTASWVAIAHAYWPDNG
jgi:hypothetical protein